MMFPDRLSHPNTGTKLQFPLYRAKTYSSRLCSDGLRLMVLGADTIFTDLAFNTPLRSKKAQAFIVGDCIRAC